MKIVAISDLHGTLPETPECDLLLIGGDVTPVWNHQRQYQSAWLKSDFSQWLLTQPAKEIVGIAGNHDFVLSDSRKLGDKLPWKYLQDETVDITVGEETVRVHGTPWTPRFGAWAFMEPDSMLTEKWDKIPTDVDILLSHGPMYGYADVVAGYSLTKRGWIESERVGSKTLRHRLDYGSFPNLKLFVCGHIHEEYGVYPVSDTLTVYNVSHMNDEYEPKNPPVEIEWRKV